MKRMTPTPAALLLISKQQLTEAKLSSLEAIIGAARKGSMGLVVVDDKTPEWVEAKRQYSICWNTYRSINASLSKLRKAVGYESINGKRVAIYQYK